MGYACERDPTPVAVGRPRVHARSPRPQTVPRHGPTDVTVSPWDPCPLPSASLNREAAEETEEEEEKEEDYANNKQLLTCSQSHQRAIWTTSAALSRRARERKRERESLRNYSRTGGPGVAR
jgi:hypothetical protein